MPNASAKWMEQLERATNYAELQSIFTEIAAAAQTAVEDQQFAKSIDHAILRMEQERTRDQQELDQRDSSYSEFKQQQSGFTGWLKRHIPFSETRRQDHSHRDLIDEQQAEVLADNLIIARAQMLKEHLLPADQRRTGYALTDWQRRLLASESTDQLRDFAKHLQELGGELACSETFLRELSDDISAFTKAKFSKEEDKRRQRSDMEASKSELSTLQAEMNKKRELHTTALRKAGELVKSELASHDPDFDLRHRRLADLEHCLKQLKGCDQALAELTATITSMQELLSKHAQTQSEIEKCTGEVERMTREADAAEQLCVTARNSHAEYAERYQIARRAADHKQTAWQAVKQIYDSQSAPAQAEISDAAQFSHDSQLATQYQRLTSDHEYAQEQLSIAAAPFESARGELNRIENSLEKLRTGLTAHAKKRTDLASANRQTQSKLIELEQQVWREREKVEVLLAEYRAAAVNFAWTPGSVQRSPDEHRRWPVSSVFEEVQQHSTPTSNAERWVAQLADTYHKLTAQLESDRRDLKKQLSGEQQQVHQVWEKRCRDLLGVQIADLVCK